MKATAKFHVNYNGVWYAKGDVIDVADTDKSEMAAYCDFVDESETLEPVAEAATPKRGRRKKSED